ncbi:hypothetical protein Halru_1910 [Halovivax ruber XH-70]|uniref:HTH arsR-type domain-containing protein n=1 Tax=Halovivax ruber (strain DSM 18193 / JCM 13892 / XH-70) TaxID=797302 RepID=L0ICF7_HALRX|nr:helix-turn-helix domain-containing protein [Halovivax ruber]AGB16508.1 hypothetical protein Halru_1910 [Halovivax ruber XH-70]
MHSSTSSLTALAVGLVLLCGLTVGGASATTGGQATFVDNTTEELTEPSEELDESTEDLVNSSETLLDDTETTVDASEELNETADQLNESADEVTSGADSGTELLEDTNSTDEDGSLDGGMDLDGTLTEVESVLSLETRSNESVIAVRLDTALGQTNSSVTVELGSQSTADDGSESTDDETDRSEAMVPPASDSGNVVDAGLVGLLGGLSLLGGVGTGSGAGAGGAGAAGATSSLFGQTVGSVLRLLGGVSGLAGKLPLSLLRYSRYDDSDPLEHETRRAIFDSIEGEPGRYLTALESAHDVSLSTIRHHLSVLEDEGLVEARKQGGKRRYYPAQTDGVELAAALDEPAKVDILTTLEAVGEAHNGRLADELGLDPSTVSHHVSTLESDGLIERRRDGRTIINTLAPNVENALGDRAETDRTTTHRPVRVPSDD